MSTAELVAAPAYHVARTVLGTAARVYFRRIEVRHADRVPARGPLLVVANHPASFTDVIVLGVALSRRLHFLAMAPIFKPWIRGLGLRMCGTLPIYRREDDPTQVNRNDDTFRACHEYLDRGAGVLIFPEGTSRTDRSIVKVKTGAARLALGQDARPGQLDRLTVLPVGIHFDDRTRFQSDVSISIGRPIDLAQFRGQAATDPPGAVRALTDHIQAVLEKLIVNVPEVDRAEFVAAVERLYRDDLRPHVGGTPDVGIARGIADYLDYFAHADPDRIERIWQRIRRYDRKLETLRIEDSAVREMQPATGPIPEWPRLVALGLLGAVPALLGAFVHYVAYWLSGRVSLLSKDPTHTAGMRIAVAVLVFPLTYGAIAWGLWRGLHWSPENVLLALAVLAVLGLHAMLYFSWLRHQRQRIRLLLAKASNLRGIARLRRERRELIALFDRSRRDYEAARRAASRAT